MNIFLNKILQLDSIRDAILLSHHGEPLFYDLQKEYSADKRTIDLWNKIIEELNKPKTADFLFDRGRYYLQYTAIGYLIIAMDNAINLQRVKVACANVHKKLSDPTTCKKVLLKMLSLAHNILQPSIIKELVPHADQEVAHFLIALLKKENEFLPAVRETIVLYICQTLGYCSSPDAVQPLQEIIRRYTTSANGPRENKIKTAAETAIKQLGNIVVDEPVNNIKPVKTEARIAPEPQENTTPPTPAPPAEQQQPYELLKENDKAEAIAMTMQLIEKAAHEKQFEKAEKLRDKIIQIDSMALMEIIRAAEIIEEAKSAAINSDYLTTWKELAQKLTNEEISALYHALIPKNYEEGEMVARQGESLANLFFVDQGNIQIYAVSQERNIPLKIVAPGEIIGAETFFDPSVWTINAKSLGANVSILTFKKLQQLKESHPTLESKLLEFCAGFESVNALFKKTKRTRRASERKSIHGRTTIALLDKHGRATGTTAKGDLLDISRGGVSFCLHFSKKENADALLGHTISITIRKDISVPPLVNIGLIVAVRCHDFIGNEYSLHVKFNKPISGTQLQQVTQGS